MVEEEIRFLADESCDFAVVRSLRSAGYDVIAVSESCPSAADVEVLKAAVGDRRILITEDSDFGEWIYAHKEKMNGVIFIALSLAVYYTVEGKTHVIVWRVLDLRQNPRKIRKALNPKS